MEWSLTLFNKFNLEFQSEKVVVHNLHEKICTIYQKILFRFLQREHVMMPNLGEINPVSQRHQLHDAALYLGVKMYELLKHPDVISLQILHSFSHDANFFTKLQPPKLKNDITWNILSCQSYKFLNLHQRFPTILGAIFLHLCL